MKRGFLFYSFSVWPVDARSATMRSDVKVLKNKIVDAVHLVVVGDRGNLRVAWPCRFAASRPPRSPANRGGVARRRARANSRAWSRRRRMSGARPSRPRWKNVVKGRVVFHLFTPNRDGSMKNWNFTVNFSIKSNEKWRDHFTVKSRTLSSIYEYIDHHSSRAWRGRS